jgi:hypothetical protein
MNEYRYGNRKKIRVRPAGRISTASLAKIGLTHAGGQHSLLEGSTLDKQRTLCKILYALIIELKTVQQTYQEVNIAEEWFPILHAAHQNHIPQGIEPGPVPAQE